MNNISVLYSEEELALSVKKLGAEITEEYKGKKLLVVCVLKGAFVFTTDLVRSRSSFQRAQAQHLLPQ